MNDSMLTVVVTALGVLVAVAALLGPALFNLGRTMGEMRASTRAAHHRLDSLEAELKTGVDALGDRLDKRVNEAMEKAHLWCPFAQRHVNKPKPGD